MKIPHRTMLSGAYIKVALGLLLMSLSAAAQTRQFTVKNNCSETVWVAGAGNPTPVFNGSPGGLEVGPGGTVITTVPVPWVAGRFWGRRNCTFDSAGHGSCATGDCGGVLQCAHTGAGTTSLAEFQPVAAQRDRGAVVPRKDRARNDL